MRVTHRQRRLVRLHTLQRCKLTRQPSPFARSAIPALLCTEKGQLVSLLLVLPSIAHALAWRCPASILRAGNKTTDALRMLDHARRVILTGTPMQNDFDELWAMCDFAAPGALPPLPRFRAIFAAPIEAGRQPAASAEQQRCGVACFVEGRSL